MVGGSGRLHAEGSSTKLYYPQEVRRGKYWGLEVFLLQYFPHVKIGRLLHYNCININIVG